MSAQQPPAGPPPEADPPTQPYPPNGHSVAVTEPVYQAPPPSPVAYQSGPPAMPPGVPPMAPAAVPAVPPSQGHGAGWWVGVIAAAAAVAVLLILGGFFLGRGTRLSDDTVQTKINQQRQADQISQQRALSGQADQMRHDKNVAVKSAADRARARGIRQGRSEGRQTGFQEGQDTGFNSGQSSGYAQGQNDGYNEGLTTGSCLADISYC